jgi:hypothetical protein
MTNIHGYNHFCFIHHLSALMPRYQDLNGTRLFSFELMHLLLGSVDDVDD